MISTEAIPADLMPTTALLEGANGAWAFIGAFSLIGMIFLPIIVFIGVLIVMLIVGADRSLKVAGITAGIAFLIMGIATIATVGINTTDTVVYYAADGTCLQVGNDCVDATDVKPDGIISDGGTFYPMPFLSDLTQVDPR